VGGRLSDLETAQCIGGLRRLRSLHLDSVETAEQWAALSLAQLTALTVDKIPAGASFEGLAALEELTWGEPIRVDQARRLARGAPNLKKIRITMEGDGIYEEKWAARAGVVFPHVTHAYIDDGSADIGMFCASDFWPAVTELEICGHVRVRDKR
jgi:hypothetical protein